MSERKVHYDTAKYKVVELATVTDETIEDALNAWIPRGWNFDQIQFVVREASRRPSMAFIFFTRPMEIGSEEPAYSHEKPQEDSGCEC